MNQIKKKNIIYLQTIIVLARRSHYELPFSHTFLSLLFFVYNRNIFHTCVEKYFSTINVLGTPALVEKPQKFSLIRRLAKFYLSIHPLSTALPLYPFFLPDIYHPSSTPAFCEKSPHRLTNMLHFSAELELTVNFFINFFCNL